MRLLFAGAFAAMSSVFTTYMILEYLPHYTKGSYREYVDARVTRTRIIRVLLGMNIAVIALFFVVFPLLGVLFQSLPTFLYAFLMLPSIVGAIIASSILALSVNYVIQWITEVRPKEKREQEATESPQGV